MSLYVIYFKFDLFQVIDIEACTLLIIIRYYSLLAEIR